MDGRIDFFMVCWRNVHQESSISSEKLAQTTRARRIKDPKHLEAATGLVDTGHMSSLPGASLERQTADGRSNREMDDGIALLYIAKYIGGEEQSYPIIHVWGILISHPITCVSPLDTESAGISQTFTYNTGIIC